MVSALEQFTPLSEKADTPLSHSRECEQKTAGMPETSRASK